MPKNVIGVDVAKDWIDVFHLDGGRARRIESSPRALKAFAAAAAGALVVFEASGGYDRPLAEALEAAGVAYRRVNPRHAREYARATGRLAKTDKVDARVLAEMGDRLDLAPTPPVPETRRALAELAARREDLVGMAAQEKNRLRQARDPRVRRDVAATLALLVRRKRAIEKEIARHVGAHADLADLDRRLKTAPGVGPVAAAVLIARLPELGSLDRRALASLAGLAPHADDSGRRRGKRRTWGGRADVRRALYMAAFAATRCDAEFKAFRRKLSAAGKPFKAVIVAAARKLLVAINAAVKEGRDFQKRPA